MTGLLDYLARLFGGIAFWIIVQPWQQALRVRAGKYVRLLGPGLYLKIPVLDAVHVESVRRRTSLIPTQTLCTRDGHTVTISAVITYVIADIERLYRSLHHAEDTIAQTAQGFIADEIFSWARAEIGPIDIGERVTARFVEVAGAWGLSDPNVRLTDFAYVRAFRLINDGRWSHGQALNTEGVERPRP